MVQLCNGPAKVLTTIVALGILLVACREDKVFPVEPVITFKSIELFGDSASLTIGFTDGDGDIGLDQTDNSPPFDSESAWYNNLFLGYHQMVDGEWTEPTLMLPLQYRIPRLNATGQNKALEGEIAVGIAWPIFPMPPGSPDDTVRFSVQLVDRAIHQSNVVLTDAILVDH